MERPVKERLVGAAVLVAVVVLVVPALLSGPREPQAPEPVAAGQPHRIEIDLAGAQPQPDPTEQDELVAAAEGAPPADIPARPVEAPPAAAGQAAVTAAVPAGDRPQDDVATPPPTVSPKPAAPVPATGWAVQVAALSNRDAAARLAADLKGRGYTAFVLEHRAEGKLFYRVRIGPEAQRERADALASRLKKEGFKAAVVAHP